MISIVVNLKKFPHLKIDNATLINWELLESLDWDLILSDLFKLDSRQKYLIKSFIPFASPQIEPLVDSLINIEYNESDFEEALIRRVKNLFKSLIVLILSIEIKL